MSTEEPATTVAHNRREHRARTSAHVLATMGEPHGGDRRWQEYVASLSEDSAYVQEIKERLFCAMSPHTLGPWRPCSPTTPRESATWPVQAPTPAFLFRRTELATDEIDRDGSNLAMFLDLLSANDSEHFLVAPPELRLPGC